MTAVDFSKYEFYFDTLIQRAQFMWIKVLILDGNSEIGAHERSNLRYMISFMHLIRSGAVTNRIFQSEKIYYPSYVRNMFWVMILYKYHDLKCHKK